jgi:hypothetical protein
MYPRAFVNQAQLPAEGAPTPVIQRLPDYWNTAGTMEAKGWATYSLTIRLPESAIREGTPLAFRLSDSISACSYWIDGVKVYSSGTPATSWGEELPSFKPGLFFFTPRATTINLDVRVSNFNYRVGGIWAVPVLGNAERISDEWNRSTQAVLFLFGALMIMVVYQASIFASRHKERSALGSVLSALPSREDPGTGNCLLQQWIPGLTGNRAGFEFLPMAMPPVFHLIYRRPLSRTNERRIKRPEPYRQRVWLSRRGPSHLPCQAISSSASRRNSLLDHRSPCDLVSRRAREAPGALVTLASVVRRRRSSRHPILLDGSGFAYLLSIGLFAFIATQVILSRGKSRLALTRPSLRARARKGKPLV